MYCCFFFFVNCIVDLLWSLFIELAGVRRGNAKFGMKRITWCTLSLLNKSSNQSSHSNTTPSYFLYIFILFSNYCKLTTIHKSKPFLICKYQFISPNFSFSKLSNSTLNCANFFSCKPKQLYFDSLIFFPKFFTQLNHRHFEDQK